MTATAEERSALLSQVGRGRQNGPTLGRLLATGGIAHAEELPDSGMRAETRLPPDLLTWDPSVLSCHMVDAG
jgi:PQQ system protein